VTPAIIAIGRRQRIAWAVTNATGLANGLSFTAGLVRPTTR
jgi:hypothetical protein